MHDAAHAQEALAGLPADIADSPLFNADLAPVPYARRDWTTYNFAALWIAMAHCIPTYMYAGNLLSAGMNAWQAMLVIALGNGIVLIPILLNAHPGTKYGIPFPVLARSAFGTSGAQIPAVLRALVACGWFGVQTFLGGEAVRTFVETLWPHFHWLGGIALDADRHVVQWPIPLTAGLTVPSAITFGVFWALNIAIIYRGMNAVRLFENWAAPLVLAMAALLMGWVVYQVGGVGDLLTKPSTFTTFGQFWWAFVPQVTAMIGFWSTLSLNIPDFTRYGRDQRSQMIGQALGLPPTMIGFSAMGLVITSASAQLLPGAKLSQLWNPEFILAQITSAHPVGLPLGHVDPLIASAIVRIGVAIFALFGIGVATVSVNIAANVISPANDFANLAPKYISFQTGGLITGLLGILILPWKLLALPNGYVFTWLIGYSALLGPIAGIMIVDYWLVRKTILDVPDLYRSTGRYKGVNLVAVGALAAGVFPNVGGFLHAIGLWGHKVADGFNVTVAGFGSSEGANLLILNQTCRSLGLTENSDGTYAGNLDCPGIGPLAVHALKLATPITDTWDSIYVYAWFVGFAVAAVVYFAGSPSKTNS